VHFWVKLSVTCTAKVGFRKPDWDSRSGSVSVLPCFQKCLKSLCVSETAWRPAGATDRTPVITLPDPMKAVFISIAF
jgi:hypothetical protein